MPERKSLTSVHVKDADKGQVSAVIATLNVRDHDGDVILPGAFESGQKVRISAFNHASWGPSLPVGKGTIREEGDEARFDGQFFLNTETGRETFETVKGLEDLGEWSFGFDLRQGATRQGEHQGEDVRFIGPLPDGTAGIDTHEVSPVLLGAGINTRTLAVKSLSDLSVEAARKLADDIEDAFKNGRTLVLPGDIEIDPYARGDMKLTDHITVVTDDLTKLTERLTDVLTLRAEQGKTLGDESTEAAADLKEAADALRDVLTNAAEPSEASQDLDLDVAFEIARSRDRL